MSQNRTATPQEASSSIYVQQDLDNITAQLRKRTIIIGAPCLVLLAVLIWSLLPAVRLEWVTTLCTILIGVILIAAYDLALKPIICYRNFLTNALHGRVRETTLPFIALSEDVNMVDGVACRALTCQDVDGKGRNYERLFYFDCEKTFPDFQEGELLHIVHHDLMVANIFRA